MPASDSSIAANAPPSHGRCQIKPRYASRSSISASALDAESTVMIPNALTVITAISHQIIGYGLNPQRAAREKSDQRIAQMRNRRIRQDPLEIGWQQREQIADQDRSDGDDFDHHPAPDRNCRRWRLQNSGAEGQTSRPWKRRRQRPRPEPARLHRRQAPTYGRARSTV